MFNLALGNEVEIDDRKYILTRPGISGHVVFGPYVTLFPSSYEVHFPLALAPGEHGQDGICAEIEVTSDFGNHRLTSAEIACSDLSTDFRSFTLRFDLEQEQTVEFRVIASGSAALIVDGEPQYIRLPHGPIVSHAQAKEDVLLWRALAPRVHHSEGFWIDVGGYDPDIDSVTRIFSDHAWRGINIEPLADNFERFVRVRPRDINIRAAVTDTPGEVLFHEIVGHQLGTIEDRFADRHEDAGFERRSYTVPAMTLTHICEQHAPAEIHFLKIDVEGHEANVLRGMDFSRFRPWILVIEAAEPNNLAKSTYHEWEDGVLAAGYEFVQADMINRYYVAREHPELKPVFYVPADDYVLAAELRRRLHLERRLNEAEARIRELENHRTFWQKRRVSAKM